MEENNLCLPNAKAFLMEIPIQSEIEQRLLVSPSLFLSFNQDVTKISITSSIWFKNGFIKQWCIVYIYSLTEKTFPLLSHCYWNIFLLRPLIRLFARIIQRLARVIHEWSTAFIVLSHVRSYRSNGRFDSRPDRCYYTRFWPSFYSRLRKSSHHSSYTSNSWRTTREQEEMTIIIDGRKDVFLRVFVFSIHLYIKICTPCRPFYQSVSRLMSVYLEQYVSLFSCVYVIHR